VGKPEGKGALGRPRHRWMDNVKMDLRKIERGGIDWIDLAQDRDQWRVLVKTAMNLKVPLNTKKFLNSCTMAGPREGLSPMKLVILPFSTV
jgi:hypothetical protein